MKFHLVGRYGGTADAGAQLDRLCTALRRLKVYVTKDDEDEACSRLNALDADTTVIVFGGDGTMLNCAKAAAPRRTLGINQGRLGFITDIPGSFSADELAYHLVHDHVTLEPRNMLQISGDVIFFNGASNLALNEIVAKAHGGKLIELDIHVSGVLAYTMRADGIVISTPTGSTAYNLSAGGPIMHPQTQVVCLTPLHPQTLSNRPIILPNNLVIDITVKGNSDLIIDGKLLIHKIAIDSAPDLAFQVKAADVQANFVHIDADEFRHDYFGSLRTKLNWFLPTC